MPDVDRAERVDVFFVGNCGNDGFFVQLFRERQLAENAVNRIFVVQFLDKREQFFLRCLFGQGVFFGKNPRRFAGFLFVVDIGARRRVVADDNHGEPHRNALFF